MEMIDLERCRAMFHAAPFVRDTGIEPVAVAPGECESVLQLAPRHLQHTGVVHAGVITTMADHTAGIAAQTMVRGGGIILTADIKVSLLRAAKGERLVCRAKVIKPGSQISFTEAEVYCDDKLVAKLSATMAVVEQRR